MNIFNKNTLDTHANMILDAINDERITDEMVADNEVHHEVFNTDYFIIGCYQAEKWIIDNFGSVFEAIEIVQGYEKLNFGKTSCPLNARSIANMLSYICGEHVLSELGEFETVAELKQSVVDFLEQ